MKLFAIIGVLTAFFNYRNAKCDGTSLPKAEKPAVAHSVEKLLRPRAGRLERSANWLGFEY